MLAGAAIVAVSRRQHCITMSSCEAELVALADLAIELLHVIEVVKFLGHAIDGAIEACTDSKSAYDLCHRFTTAQNSRHVDRKMFKMRELRGAGVVTVRYVPTDENTARTCSRRCSSGNPLRSTAARCSTLRLRTECRACVAPREGSWSRGGSVAHTRVTPHH